MNWSDLLRIVGDEPLFPTGMLLAGETKTDHVRRQLDRWVKSGKLLQLRRGLYALADPYRKVVSNPFVIANRLRGASYVSLQSALAHHGMIPEHVPVVTSITTGRPQVIDTPLGRYSYRHIQQARFHGFALVEISDGQHAFVARPEKALLDLLYLTPGSDDEAFLPELRLNLADSFDWALLESLIEGPRCPKLRRAARHLKKLAASEGWEEL